METNAFQANRGFYPFCGLSSPISPKKWFNQDRRCNLSYRHHVGEIRYSKGNESEAENLAIFGLWRNVAIANRGCKCSREEKRIVVVPSKKFN